MMPNSCVSNQFKTNRHQLFISLAFVVKSLSDSCMFMVAVQHAAVGHERAGRDDLGPHELVFAVTILIKAILAYQFRLPKSAEQVNQGGSGGSHQYASLYPGSDSDSDSGSDDDVLFGQDEAVLLPAECRAELSYGTNNNSGQDFSQGSEKPDLNISPCSSRLAKGAIIFGTVSVALSSIGVSLSSAAIMPHSFAPSEKQCEKLPYPALVYAACLIFSSLPILAFHWPWRKDRAKELMEAVCEGRYSRKYSPAALFFTFLAQFLSIAVEYMAGAFYVNMAWSLIFSGGAYSGSKAAIGNFSGNSSNIPCANPFDHASDDELRFKSFVMWTFKLLVVFAAVFTQPLGTYKTIQKGAKKFSALKKEGCAGIGAGIKNSVDKVTCAWPSYSTVKTCFIVAAMIGDTAITGYTNYVTIGVQIGKWSNQPANTVTCISDLEEPHQSIAWALLVGYTLVNLIFNWKMPGNVGTHSFKLDQGEDYDTVGQHIHGNVPTKGGSDGSSTSVQNSFFSRRVTKNEGGRNDTQEAVERVL